MKRTFSLLLVAGTIGLAACGGSGAPQESWHASVYDGPTVVTKTEFVTGTGAEALPGTTVKAVITRWHYNAAAPGFKGELYTGQVPPAPSTLTLTIYPAAPDLADAIVGMRVGGRRGAVIPGDMAPDTRPTSNNGLTGIVPKRPPVVAEIELLEVN